MVALTFALIASLLTGSGEPRGRAPRLRPMPDDTVEQLDLLSWRPQPRDPQAQVLQRIGTAQDRERQRLHQELVRAGRWDQRIHALARRWLQPGVALEELVQAGHVGLLEAVRRYRPGSEGWNTYATTWVRKELERLTRRQGAIVMETEHERKRRRREGLPRRPGGWAELPT